MKNLQRTTARAPLAATLLLACALPLAGCAGEGSSELEPWPGTLAEGLATIEDLSAQGRFDDALLIADRMDRVGALAGLRARAAEITAGASEDLLAPLDRSLSGLGLPVLTSPQRGEIQFARAVALLGSTAETAASNPAAGPTAGPAAGPTAGPEDAAGRMERAVAALKRARAAGGGASLDAVYDLGTLDLLVAESIRATLPEVSGGPPPPPPSDKDAASGKDDQDPLDLARAAYLAARGDLVERLRMGAGEDARANAELVLRRLRELDEIERQREEQQEEQQDPQSEGEPSDESQENEGSEEEQQDPSESEDEEQQGDQESESEQSSEEEPEEEPEEESEEESEDSQEEEPADEPADESEDAQEEAEDDPGEGEELMTAEELSRLLDLNRKYQENGEELRRILRLGRKVPARRDW